MFLPVFAAQMQDSLQELVKPPMRGNQTWRDARLHGRLGLVPTGLLKCIRGDYANDR